MKLDASDTQRHTADGQSISRLARLLPKKDNICWWVLHYRLGELHSHLSKDSIRLEYSVDVGSPLPSYLRLSSERAVPGGTTQLQPLRKTTVALARARATHPLSRCVWQASCKVNIASCIAGRIGWQVCRYPASTALFRT
jgi:hypothetical protein